MPAGPQEEPEGAHRSVGSPHGLPATPRWLRVDGLRISYVDIGEGPAVLLVHGLGHSIHGWRKNLPALVEAGYRVLAVDLPGFGYSDKPSEYSLDGFVGFVEAWLELHCIDRVALVGNSLGGLVSAATASRRPDLVSAAVLVDPAGFDKTIHWLVRLAAMRPASMLMPRRMNAWRVRQALRFVYHDRRCIEEEEVERIVELLGLPGARDALLRISRAASGPLAGMRPALGLGEPPGRIEVPTLVIWGAQDRVVPVSHAGKVRAAAADSELTIFDSCGHCPMMEVPEAFNERVIRFLRERLAAA